MWQQESRGARPRKEVTLMKRVAPSAQMEQELMAGLERDVDECLSALRFPFVHRARSAPPTCSR